MSVDIAVISTGDIDLELLESATVSDTDLKFSVDSQQFFFKAFDAPSFIVFVASLPDWQKAIFLGAAGSALWDGFKKLPTFTREALSALPPLFADFACRVVALQSLVPDNTEIFLGFPSGDVFHPSRLKLISDDPAALSAQLQLFSDKIPNLIEWLENGKITPISGLHLHFLDEDRLVIEWFDSVHEKPMRHEL